MSITRLQQARQMYALGQRVRFQGGGRDASRGDFSSPSADGPGNDKDGGTNAVDTGDLGTEKANVDANRDANMSARDRAISNQYTNMPTPTVTIGVDKFDNPITVPTTYTARRARQKTLDALNAKGISSFDPRVTKTLNFLDPSNLVTSFAPQQQKKFGILDLVMIAASGGLLGPKIATGAKMFNTAKNVSKLAQTIGLTDKNVLDSFTSNFTENFGKGKKSTTKSTSTNNNNNNGGGGEGLASLDNQASGYDEYILLLQKLQSGTISDAERNRYNVLKNMLGI
jgi:hypothetical protein